MTVDFTPIINKALNDKFESRLMSRAVALPRASLGHVDDSMLSEHYTSDFPNSRLVAVASHVKSIVLGP